MRYLRIIFLSTILSPHAVYADMDEDRGLANDISKSIEIRNTLGFSEESTDEQVVYKNQLDEQHRKEFKYEFDGCQNGARNQMVKTECGKK